jgi:fatty-acyl-CoA synthase
MAWVVPKDEYKGKVTKEEIIGFLAEKVAQGKLKKFDLPDEIEFVDEIPKTSAGKFDKKVMKAKYWK